MRPGGIVLCGGLSTRMGRPKADLPLAGRPLLLHVIDTLGEAVGSGRVAVVAAADQPLPPLPAGVRVARDAAAGRGPLEGLAAGLASLADEVDAVFLAACDAPLLRPTFARRLLDLCAAGPEWCVVPAVGGFRHPTAAAYHVAVLPTLLEMLAAGRLKPGELFAAVPTRFVDADELRDADPAFDSLRNVNTLADYAALVRDHGG